MNRSGSKGILEGLNQSSREFNKESSKELKKSDSLESCNKRSYTLKNSTIRKLQELKVFTYTDPNITYNEIVDEAICMLYNTKKNDNIGG